jgi:hypothetical protein
MFQLFKKKRNLDPLDDLLKSAVQDLKDKWIIYTKATHFDNGIPLSENIDIFSQPLVEYFKERYMTLYQYSEGIFWYTLSLAILKSKTHPQGEVNIAINQLYT